MSQHKTDRLPPMIPTSSVESPWITDTGRSIAAKVWALIPLIREQAQEGERIGALTPDVLQAVTGAGIFKMGMPIEWGGYALGARDLVEIISLLGEGDGSAGWADFVGVGMKNLLALKPQVIEEVRRDTEGWAGPVIVGASVYATKVGDARKVDGGWMVKGRWAFGSGCKHAKWALLGVEYNPATAEGDGRGVVVVQRDQYEILDDWHVMGLSGSASNSLEIVSEQFVPDHRFLDLAKFPMRMQMIRDHFQQRGLAQLLTVTLTNIAIALGMARGALSCFAEQAQTRKPFSFYPTIADMASVQVAAGKSLAMIKVAAATIEGCADQLDARTAAGLDFTIEEESEISLSLSLSLSLAYAGNLCEDAITLLQKTIGSSSMSLKNPIQRFARDIRVLTSHGAIRVDPQSEQNGRRILGREPFSMFGGAVPTRDNQHPGDPLP